MGLLRPISYFNYTKIWDQTIKSFIPSSSIFQFYSQQDHFVILSIERLVTEGTRTLPTIIIRNNLVTEKMFTSLPLNWSLFFGVPHNFFFFFLAKRMTFGCLKDDPILSNM